MLLAEFQAFARYGFGGCELVFSNQCDSQFDQCRSNARIVRCPPPPDCQQFRLKGLCLDKISPFCQCLSQEIESSALLFNRPIRIFSVQVNRFTKKGRGFGEFALSVKCAAEIVECYAELRIFVPQALSLDFECFAKEFFSFEKFALFKEIMAQVA